MFLSCGGILPNSCDWFHLVSLNPLLCIFSCFSCWPGPLSYWTFILIHPDQVDCKLRSPIIHLYFCVSVRARMRVICDLWAYSVNSVLCSAMGDLCISSLSVSEDDRLFFSFIFKSATLSSLSSGRHSCNIFLLKQSCWLFWIFFKRGKTLQCVWHSFGVAQIKKVSHLRSQGLSPLLNTITQSKKPRLSFSPLKQRCAINLVLVTVLRITTMISGHAGRELVLLSIHVIFKNAVGNSLFVTNFHTICPEILSEIFLFYSWIPPSGWLISLEDAAAFALVYLSLCFQPCIKMPGSAGCHGASSLLSAHFNPADFSSRIFISAFLSDVFLRPLSLPLFSSHLDSISERR